MARMTTGDVMLIGALTFCAGAAFAGPNEEGPTGNEAADRADALVAQYETTAKGNLRTAGDNAIRILASLRPAEYQDGGDKKWKLSEGRWLQDQVLVASSGLLATGEFPDDQVDQMSVATKLIPKETQKVMRAAGLYMTPLVPVACDGPYPDYQNPWDYSNHVPSDVAVTLYGGNTVRIPLGVAQAPLGHLIGADEYEAVPRLDLAEIPCDEIPQQSRDPAEPIAFKLY